MRHISSFRCTLPVMLLLSISAGQLLAQSMDQRVLGTTGREVQQGPVQLSFTVGEVATSSFMQDTLYITQGYQQVIPEGSTAIHGQPVPVDFLVYPNPFSDVVTFRWIGNTTASTMVLHWTDAAGRSVLTRTLDWASGKEVQLEVRSLPPGVYQIQMMTLDAIPVASFQLIRIIP